MSQDKKLPFELGKAMAFSGVDNNQFKLDGVIYEALEDPSDGYRSYMSTVVAATSTAGIFFPNPIDVVYVVEDKSQPQGNDSPNEGYKLVSILTGHVWLEFGTEYGDSYYPSFYFRYTPAEGTTRPDAATNSKGYKQ